MNFAIFDVKDFEEIRVNHEMHMMSSERFTIMLLVICFCGDNAM